jgi:hypothetical protein
MLRHVASVLTAAFLGLLLLLGLSGQGPDAGWASALLLLGALAVFALFLATERALHRGPR